MRPCPTWRGERDTEGGAKSWTSPLGPKALPLMILGLVLLRSMLHQQPLENRRRTSLPDL